MKSKLLLMCLALLVTIPATAYDFLADGLCYNINSDNATATVVGHEGSLPERVVIPSTIYINDKEYPVTNIGNAAFMACSGITNVIIPNSVSIIGTSAFYDCTGLTNVDIPNSVISIGITAFNNCNSLSSLTIPNSVVSIGNSAFYGCSSLTSVTIPSSVTTIGHNVFSSCSSLMSISVEDGNNKYDSRSNCNAIIETETNTLISGCKNTTIPNSVTAIGGIAFYGCSGLTRMTIPNSVNTIGSSAFYYCSGLTSITIPNSVTTIGDWAFANCSGLTSVTIPNSVTSIGDDAFCVCSSLTSITIPNSVTSIGSGTFAQCSSLTDVTIPNSITSIGSAAFSLCSNLASITIPSSVNTIGGYAFFRCTGLMHVICLSNTPPTANTDAFKEINTSTCSLHVPQGASSAYRSATGWSIFTNIIEGYNGSATEGLIYTINSDGTTASVTGHSTSIVGALNIPASTIIDGNTYSVTAIGASAFRDCNQITSVGMPTSITSIYNYAFQYCSSLTNVTIPNSVKTIGVGAFYGCSSLTEISIPESVTFIGYSALYCSSLETLYFNAKNCYSPYYHSGGDSYDVYGIYSYDGTPVQRTNIKRIIIGDNVQYIPNHFAYNQKNLSTVTMGKNVEYINEYAFSGCSSLGEITIPETAKKIDVFAFEGCSSLATIYYNAIDCIFIEKSSLVAPGYYYDVYGNYNGWSVPDRNVNKIVIGNKVQSLPKHFVYRHKLNNPVTIPSSVRYISSNAFDSSELQSITFSEGLDSIANNAFYGCRMSSINLPKSLRTIGSSAFANCYNLISVNCDEGLISIGNNAFYKLSTKANIILPSSVLTIGKNAFNYYNSLYLKAATPPSLPNGWFIEGSNCVCVSTDSYHDYISTQGQWQINQSKVLPYPINKISNSTATTSTTVSVQFNVYALEEIRLEDCDIIFRDIESSNKYYRCENIEKRHDYNMNADYYVVQYLITGLIPSTTYQYFLSYKMNGVNYSYYKDGYTGEAFQVATEGGNLIINRSNTPTSIRFQGGRNIHADYNVAAEWLYFLGKTYSNDNPVIVTGLNPETSYTVQYGLRTVEGDNYFETTSTSSTPALTMTAQAAKMLTNTQPLFVAETNMADEETSCGFEWRRYDAPEEMPSVKVYSPVMGGMMMGTLKNMTENVYYKYRPFYKASDGTEYYGNWIAFITADAGVYYEPVAYTYEQVTMGDDGVTINGAAIPGSESITEQGFAYWVTGAASAPGREAAPASGASTVTATGQRMSVKLTDLAPGKPYAYCTYVKTASGTFYGQERTFKTPVTSMPGDVNGDSIVSGADVTALYNVLLDGATAGGDGDVNGDDVVSGADVTALYNLLLGQ